MGQHVWHTVWAMGWTVRGWDLGGDKRLFVFQSNPDRFWGYWLPGSLLGVEGPGGRGVQLTGKLHIVRRVGMGGAVLLCALCRLHGVVRIKLLEKPSNWKRLRLLEFIDNRHMNLASCQPYAPTAFTRGKHPWKSFMLETELNLGPTGSRKGEVIEKSQ
jgi:hypothetical protein